MCAKFTFSCFETLQCWDKILEIWSGPENLSDKIRDKTYLVGKVFEAHSGGVECSNLLSIADPEANVVESVEDTNFGLNKVYKWLIEKINLLFQWVLRNLPSDLIELEFKA